MSTERTTTAGLQTPLAQLERALIDEFVRARGHDPARLNHLAAQEREALLADASTYASAKLAEVESRSHYVHQIHDGEPV